jgi:L-ascorbate metabolism protein UlaG (beta-lactamase superfamily)
MEVINMKIKWLGWASWLIKTENKIIYIDPFKGNEKEKADIVLSSHNHPDHCDLEQLKRIRKSSTIVLTPSAFAKDINAEAFDIGQTKTIGNIKITAVPAYNLHIPNHQKGRDTGFVIEAEGKRIYFAADTDLIDEMKNLKNIDLALLPIGGTFTMDLHCAVEAVKRIKPKTVIPMHYGITDIVFGGKPMHIELKADPNEFARKIGNIAKVKVPKEGEEIEF